MSSGESMPSLSSSPACLFSSVDRVSCQAWRPSLAARVRCSDPAGLVVDRMVASPLAYHMYVPEELLDEKVFSFLILVLYSQGPCSS